MSLERLEESKALDFRRRISHLFKGKEVLLLQFSFSSISAQRKMRTDFEIKSPSPQDH